MPLRTIVPSKQNTKEPADNPKLTGERINAPARPASALLPYKNSKPTISPDRQKKATTKLTRYLISALKRSNHGVIPKADHAVR